MLTKPWMALPSGRVCRFAELPQNIVGGFRQFTFLVSLSSRPVDRGFRRSKSISTPFHPVKRPFRRMGETKVPFYPVKGRFGRTGTLRELVARGLCKQISDLAADLTPKSTLYMG